MKEPEPEIYDQLVAEWLAWDATMLPETDASFAFNFTGAQFADHIGTPPTGHKADNLTPSTAPAANPHWRVADQRFSRDIHHALANFQWM